jgi:hypothetical protein
MAEAEDEDMALWVRKVGEGEATEIGGDGWTADG